MAFSPDGSRFLTGGGHILRGPGEARLWRTATREPIGKALTYDDPIYVVAFDPTGQTFFTAGGNSLIQLYDVETAKLLKTFPNPDKVLSAAFSPNGRMLLTGDNKGIARAWNVATGQPIAGPLSVFGHEGTASLESDESAMRRSAQSGPDIGSSIASGRVVMGMAFSPDESAAPDWGRRYVVRGGAAMGDGDGKAHRESLSSSAHGSARGVQP